MQLTVYVLGNLNLYEDFFQKISLFMRNYGFYSFLKCGMLIGGSIAIFRMIYYQNIKDLVHWLFVFYVAMYVIFSPKVDILIQDERELKTSSIIHSIPLGLAVIAHLSSSLNAGLVKLVESSLNDSYKDFSYLRSGFLLGSRLVSFNIDPQSLPFYKSLEDFKQRCLLYDVFLQKYSLLSLEQSSIPWDFIKNNTSINRTFFYQNHYQSCNLGLKALLQEWPAIEQSILPLYASIFFPGSSEPQKTFLENLSLSYQFFIGTKQEASFWIWQKILYALLVKTSILNSGSTLLPAPTTLQSIGISLLDILPLLKNILHILGYSAFVFVIFLSFLPNGLLILEYYTLVILWIESWDMLWAIMHMVLLYYSKLYVSSLSYSALSLSGLIQLMDKQQDILSFAGYVLCLAPLLTGIFFYYGFSILRQTSITAYREPTSPFQESMSLASSLFKTEVAEAMPIGSFMPNMGPIGMQSFPHQSIPEKTLLVMEANEDMPRSYWDWLQEQPGTNGKGKLGRQAAWYIEKSEPSLKKYYRKQFFQYQNKNV